jgi:hypothetical protein
VCAKDDLSAAAVVEILRCAKEMEKTTTILLSQCRTFPKTETNASSSLWRQNDRPEIPGKF